MLKIGDRVRFVNDAMDGVITSINGKIAGVTTADDFEIPVVMSELVKIDEIKSHLSEEKQSVQPQTKFVKAYSGIHIAFERLTDSMLELKLQNSEADLIQYSLYHKRQNMYTLFQKGELSYDKHIGLGIFHLEEIQKWPVLAFQISFIYNECSQLKNPLVAELNLHTKSFHRSFGQCFFLGKQAYHFRLDNDVSQLNLELLKNKDFTSANTDKMFKIAPVLAEEIDLHIENLTDNYKQLTAQQMFDIQLSTAIKTIDSIYASGQKRIILIHGVGNNFLKKKIEDMLKKHQAVKTFEPADSIKYGGGATEVWIRD